MINVAITGIKQVLTSDFNANVQINFNWSEQSDVTRYIGWDGSVQLSGVYSSSAVTELLLDLGSATIDLISEGVGLRLTTIIANVDFDTIIISSTGDKATTNRIDALIADIAVFT
jgi:hypothetical protein